MTPLPLRTTLTLIYASLLAAIVAGLAAGYHQLLVRQVDRDATAALEELVRGLHGYVQIRNGQPAIVYDPADREEAAFVDEATRYYQLFDLADGRLVAQSAGLAAAGLDYGPAEVTTLAQAGAITDVGTDAGRLRLSSTVVTPAPGRRFLLQVGVPLRPFDRTIAGLERSLAWGVGLAVIAAVIVGRWMAGRALGPLSRLATATHAIDITRLDQRLPVRGAGDELDDVATAFNRALDRVERSVRDMRQFSAALAHELRTPLAVLRGETELALTAEPPAAAARERLESQLEEIDRLNAFIGQVLTLARAESGQLTLARETVDLAGLARRCVEQLDAVAEAREVTLICGDLQAATVTGDPAWLGRLLFILLDNAITFTPAGGRVSVALSADRGMAALEVSDTGIGIAPEDHARIFEPFHRGANGMIGRREGAGLGLALAQWIAEQHGGAITVTSLPGAGSTFRVRLPLAH